MKPLLISVAFIVEAQPVFAHVGHLGTVAGHDHWVAGIALGAAIGLALWGALKGKDDKDKGEQDADDGAETPATEEQAA